MLAQRSITQTAKYAITHESKSFLSIRPGRIRAGSRCSGWLVVITTMRSLGKLFNGKGLKVVGFSLKTAKTQEHGTTFQTQDNGARHP